MEITDRFARLWERWDRGVRDRSDVPGFLASAKDEDLIELLAATSPQERKYERDVVATEILNRLRKRTNDLPTAAEQVLLSAEAAYQAAVEGQKAIHTAEGLLKATGEEQLGAEVSATAYASLDTTKLALEAAQQNSADVRATIAQSRVAHQFAQDATESAREVSDAARAAAEPLAHAGRHEAAEAAIEAAERIERAAELTVAAVEDERRVEEPEREPTT